MPAGRRRLAAELVPDGPGLRLESAVVATVTPAGAADGNSLVTVTWRGDDFPAAWLDSAPTVGQTVIVAVQPPAGLLILGAPKGTPPS
jgi:hypothetical protein